MRKAAGYGSEPRQDLVDARVQEHLAGRRCAAFVEVIPPSERHNAGILEGP